MARLEIIFLLTFVALASCIPARAQKDDFSNSPAVVAAKQAETAALSAGRAAEKAKEAVDRHSKTLKEWNVEQQKRWKKLEDRMDTLALRRRMERKRRFHEKLVKLAEENGKSKQKHLELLKTQLDVAMKEAYNKGAEGDIEVQSLKAEVANAEVATQEAKNKADAQQKKLEKTKEENQAKVALTQEEGQKKVEEAKDEDALAAMKQKQLDEEKEREEQLRETQRLLDQVKTATLEKEKQQEETGKAKEKAASEQKDKRESELKKTQEEAEKESAEQLKKDTKTMEEADKAQEAKEKSEKALAHKEQLARKKARRLQEAEAKLQREKEHKDQQEEETKHAQEMEEDNKNKEKEALENQQKQEEGQKKALKEQATKDADDANKKMAEQQNKAIEAANKLSKDEADEKAESRKKSQEKLSSMNSQEQESKKKLDSEERTKAENREEQKEKFVAKQEENEKEQRKKQEEVGKKNEQAEKQEVNLKNEQKLKKAEANEAKTKGEQNEKAKQQEQESKKLEQSQKGAAEDNQKKNAQQEQDGKKQLQEQTQKAAAKSAQEMAVKSEEREKTTDKFKLEQDEKKRELDERIAKERERQEKMEKQIEAFQEQTTKEAKAKEESKTEAKAKAELEQNRLKQEATEKKEQLEKQKAEQDGKEAGVKEAKSKEEGVKLQQKQREEEEAKAAAEREAEQLEKKKEEERIKNQNKVVLAEGYEPYGKGYLVPSFFREGSICVIGGVAFSKNLKGVIGTVNETCLPEARLLFAQHLNLMTTRIDLIRDGKQAKLAFDYSPTSITGGWASLSSMLFFVEGSDVRDFSFTSNWENYGSSFHDALYYKQNELCVLQGSVKQRGGWNSHVGTFPEECRPDGRLIFMTSQHERFTRTDVATDGKVYFQTSHRRYNWESLTGVTFFVESNTQPLDLASPWSSYNSGYRLPSYMKQGTICALSGMLRGTNGGFGVITHLPAECHPPYHMIFHGMDHTSPMRIDIFEDGKVVYVDGQTTHNWLSLDNVYFLLNDDLHVGPEIINVNYTQSVLKLEEHWKPQKNGYREPVAQSFDNICLLSGLARNSENMREIMTQLPDHCKPANDNRLVFALHGHQTKTQRFDITVDGKLRWVAGSDEGQWASLDGIVFVSGSARQEVLLLNGNFENYGGKYEPAGFFKTGDLCILSGLIKLKSGQGFSTNIGRLPRDCSPKDGRILFGVSHNEYSHRVDVLESGQIQWHGGTKKHDWLSLSGVMFATYSMVNGITGKGSWTNDPWKATWRSPSFIVQESLCILSGHFGNNGPPNAFSLPNNCRPNERLVFHSNRGSETIRIDILPDGRALLIDGPYQSWFVLDGIRFIVDKKPNPTSEAYNVTAAENEDLSVEQDVYPYNKGWQEPQLINLGNLCILSGIFRTSEIKRTLAKLPSKCRPSSTLIFNLNVNSFHPARVDIFADGQLKWQAGSSSSEWVSLDGIAFGNKETIFNPVILDNMYVNFGRGNFRDVGYFKMGNLCVYSGVVRTDNWNVNQITGNIATLPGDCRPDGRRIHRLNHNEYMFRVDVTDSHIIFVSGNKVHAWISFDGLFYMTHSDSPLNLNKASYSHYGAPYSVPSVAKEGNLCVLSGLVRRGNSNNLLGQLPNSCHPDKALKFFTMYGSNTNSALNVLSNGNINIEGGSLGRSWYPLDGIMFVVSEFHESQKNGESSQFSKEGTAIELQNGFRPHTPRNQQLRNPIFTLVEFENKKELCVLSGAAEASDIRVKMGNLPESCRPKGRRIFDIENAADRTTRLDVLENGDIKWVAGNFEGGWISLDGIAFVTASREMSSLSLLNNMIPFENGYAVPTYAKIGDLCVLSGVANKRDHNTLSAFVIGTLPNECRPQGGNIINRANHNQYTLRMDVRSNGDVYINTGHYFYSWVSLDGIMFFTQTVENPLPHLNGVNVYGSGWRRPSFKKQSNFCAATGLFTRSTSHTTITEFPPACRPNERLIFSVVDEQRTLRIDVLPDGRVLFVDGNSISYIPLDGIRFVVPKSDEVEKLPIVKDGPVNLLSMNLTNGFEPYKRGVQEPMVAMFGELCLLSGYAIGPDIRSTYAILNEECRPRARIALDFHTFPTITSRVDILPNGNVMWVAGGSPPENKNFVNFDGVIFPVSAAPRISFSLLSVWTDYGRNFEQATWIKQKSDLSQKNGLCVIHGMIETPSKSWQNQVAKLPADCTPEGRLIFSVNYNELTLRADVASNGQVYVYLVRSYTHPFVSLSGLNFFTETKLLPNIGSGFSHYGGEYRGGSINIQGNICSVSGLLRGSSNVATVLPSECRPKKKIFFFVNHHDVIQKYEVNTDGRIVYLEGQKKHGWCSLSGMTFVRDS